MAYGPQVAATLAAPTIVTSDDQLDAFGYMEPGPYDYHNDYSTPAREFDPLNREFQFEWDLAACVDNYHLPKWIGPGSPSGVFDSLNPGVPWHQLAQPCWLNSPFNTQLLSAFMLKVAEQTALGACIVTILPAHRTEQKWWQQCVLGYAREIRSIKGRTKYELHGRALRAWSVEERARARMKGREAKLKPMSPNFPSCIAIFYGPRKAPPIIVPWDPEKE